MTLRFWPYGGRPLLSKAFIKNQRPPAEVAPAPSKGHPHTSSSAGGR